VLDWAVAERRHHPETVEGRIFADVCALIDARRGAPQLHAANPLEIVETGDPGLFALVRRHPAGDLTAIYNFAETERVCDASIGPRAPSGIVVDLLDGSRRPSDEPFAIPPLGVRWLVADEPAA
jgi:amylosucrase